MSGELSLLTLYWAERAAMAAQRTDDALLLLMEDIAAEYRAAAAEMKRRIAALMTSYAAEYGLSYAEAVQALSGPERMDWYENYTRLVEQVAAKQDGWEEARRNLLEQSVSARVTRLSAAVDELNAIAESAVAGSYTTSVTALAEHYASEYLHAAHDAQEATGVYTALPPVANKAAEEAMRYPWSGATFSERLWHNQEELKRQLKEVLTQGLMRGDGVDAISKALWDRMHGSFANIRRLVETELAYMQNQAALASMRDSGFENFQFLANLDERTCDECGALDKKVFPVAEGKAGVNVPPLHARCRCTIVTDIPGFEPSRFARTPEGRVKVTPGLSFTEWKRRYVQTE